MSNQLPIVLVVGAHRSGTSFLTQIISVLGFDLGKTLMLPSYDNPRGFWENQKIVTVHDDLSKQFDKDWTTMSGLPDDWAKSSAAQNAKLQIQDILETDFNQNQPWLVKDPRLCIMLPIWKDICKNLNRPLKLITILRSPQATSQSIQVRNRLSADSADSLVLSYIQAMYDNSHGVVSDTLIYETLITKTGESIFEILKEILDGKYLPSNGNIVSQIDRLILGDPNKKIEDSHIHQTYMNLTRGRLQVDSSRLKKLISELIDTDTLKSISELQLKPSLLDKKEQLVPLTQRELDKFIVKSEAHDLLKKQLGELEAKQSLDSEYKIQNAELLEETTNLRKSSGELQKAIKERDIELDLAQNQFLTFKKDSEKVKIAIEKKMQKSERAMKRRLKVVEKNINSQATQINKLQLDIEGKAKALVELQTQKNSMAAKLEQSNNMLFSEKENRQNIEVKFAELLRIKEMQETTIKFDGARSEMIESQLNTRISDLEIKLKYYENAPFKAGLKRAAFSVLRTLRRGLPLPEPIKLKIAQKMTSIALFLQPPSQLSLLPHTQEIKVSSEINFTFQKTENPIISIILPVYNEISQTIACLQSIYKQNVSVEYEVILADDCSPDPYHSILKDIVGLRYFRNKENLHFLQNCNQNARHARGEYIVFLNNDTIVKPGWLQNLYQTFFDYSNVGIVGSKLIYPSGELQEAGGIIWEDASGWNWGKGQNSSHPLYNFTRDVDYVSGASLMIKADLWREVGGFNEDLEKAYYEDTDLCFRLRSMGHRVIYQPFSEVIHIEGLSSGNDLNEGAKQYQLVNQKTFKDTWESTLRHHLPNAETPLLASDRNSRGHILYIDAVTPEPNKDSGSVDAVYSMRILIEQGYRVHFAPFSNFAYWDQATIDLQKIGVECIYHPFYSNLTSFLEERGDMFDYVVIARPECADRGLDIVLKYCPSAKIIYNTVDLHFMRMQREAKTLKQDNIKLAAKEMKEKELGYINN
ncbi:MAG: glycosyltransferase, partial [Maricaulaceae bacterium]